MITVYLGCLSHWSQSPAQWDSGRPQVFHCNSNSGKGLFKKVVHTIFFSFSQLLYTFSESSQFALNLVI